MRTIAHHHFDRTLNHDPFFFCLSDEHARKILVDKDRSITCMPDLKYGALLPADFMMQTLSWLTNQTVGVIDTAFYDLSRTEFNDVFREVEEKLRVDSVECGV